MNRILLGIIVLALSGAVWSMPTPPPVAAGAKPRRGTSNNPYNSPIRRANPNSMQGTQPSAPAIRGPNTVPVPRPADGRERRHRQSASRIRSVPSTARRHSFPTHLRASGDSNR